MMDENVKNNIFYRPELEILKHYETRGRLNRKDQIEKFDYTIKTPREILLEKMEETVELLLSIRKVIPLLPLDLPDIVGDIVDKLLVLTQLNAVELLAIIRDNPPQYEIVEGSETSPEDMYIEDTTTVQFGDAMEEITISDFRGSDIEIVIEKIEALHLQCREEYLKDLTDMTNDYALQLDEVMKSYLYPLFDVLSDLGLESVDYLNYEYEGESVSGTSGSLAHVNDKIVMQDTVCDELNSFFNKTHSPLKTNNFLQSIDVAESLRERYYKEDYELKITNSMEMFKNTSLESQRRAAEQSYSAAKSNLYNHLIDSVKLTEDICERKLESETGKGLLLSKEINIYAHKAYETTGVENGATKGAASIVTGSNVASGVDDSSASAGNIANGTVGLDSATAAAVGAPNGQNSDLGAFLTGQLNNKTGNLTAGNTLKKDDTAVTEVSFNILDIKGSLNTFKANSAAAVTNTVAAGMTSVANQATTNVTKEVAKGAENTTKEINKGVENTTKEIDKGVKNTAKEINKATTNTTKEVAKAADNVDKEADKSTGSATKVASNTAKKATSTTKKSTKKTKTTETDKK